MQVNIKIVIILLLITGAGQLFSQQIRVEDLQFEGNEDISDGDLANAIKTKANPWYRFFLFWKDSKIFDEKEFLNDLLRIEKFYHNEGYLDVIVQDYELNYNKGGDEVNIVIKIKEGEPTIVERVEFSPDNGVAIPFERDALMDLVILKKGKRYQQAELRMDYDKIIKKFSNKGYPYIKANVKPEFDDENNTVVLNWLLNPGEFSYFGDITITEDKSVSDDVIRRGLDFKEGDVFSQDDLQIAQSQIYRLELFRYVNLQMMNLRERPTRIPIRVDLKERESKAIELGVGYGSEEALRLRSNWTHRNFLGGARILRIELMHATKILPLDAEMELSQPFFFDNQNDLILKPFFTWQDEESFEARSIGFETTVSRRFTPTVTGFITNSFSRDTVRVKGRLEEDEELDDFYNKSVLSIGLRINTTDEIFTPTGGSRASIIVEEAGAVFQSKFRYYKLFGEYRLYHEFSDGWVFATQFQAGLMDGYGGTRVTPIEERFFAGGSYSVRGWGRQALGPQRINPENGARRPLGGNSKIEGSVEVRYPIYHSFTGAFFLDYGNVWREPTGFDIIGLRYALGAGLRYGTPIGPIRLDFARKLNKQYSRESNYQIHISIGQAF